MRKLMTTLFTFGFLVLTAGASCDNKKNPIPDNAVGFIVEDKELRAEFNVHVKKTDERFEQVGDELMAQKKDLFEVSDGLKTINTKMGTFVAKDDFSDLAKKEGFIHRDDLAKELAAPANKAALNDLMEELLKSNCPLLAEMGGKDKDACQKALMAIFLRCMDTKEGEEVAKTVLTKSGFDEATRKKLQDLALKSEDFTKKFKAVEALEKDVQNIKEARKKLQTFLTDLTSKAAKKKTEEAAANLTKALGQVNDLKTINQTLQAQLKAMEANASKAADLEKFSLSLQKQLGDLETKYKSLEKAKLEEIAGLKSQLKQAQTPPRFRVEGWYFKDHAGVEAIQVVERVPGNDKQVLYRYLRANKQVQKWIPDLYPHPGWVHISSAEVQALQAQGFPPYPPPNK